MDDGEHDILHFLLEEDFPAFTNVAFIFPKGQLSAVPEAALASMVSQLFTLPLSLDLVQRHPTLVR